MTYTNFEHARRVARMLESYPVYRSLDPEQRNELLTLANGKIFVVPSVSDAINAAANKHFQSKSEYIRQSVIENLKADGIDPARLSGGGHPPTKEDR
jgi:hypothetical protein